MLQVVMKELEMC